MFCTPIKSWIFLVNEHVRFKKNNLDYKKKHLHELLLFPSKYCFVLSLELLQWKYLFVACML